MSRLLQDLECLEPRTWDELAAAARFMTGVYAASFRREAMVVAGMDEWENPGGLASSFLRDYASLHDRAYAVYLGARASGLEGRHGGFDSPEERVLRMAEAGAGGTIIDGFVKAARTIVLTQTLFKGDTGAEVAEARDMAAREMFDGTLERIEDHDRLLGPVRPRPETILRIVDGELGYLPPSLRETIRSVLEFRGGPA